MLDLHKVHLDEKSIDTLKKKFGKHGNPPVIEYKGALNQITIDLNAAAGDGENANNAAMKWTTQNT